MIAGATGNNLYLLDILEIIFSTFQKIFTQVVTI